MCALRAVLLDLDDTLIVEESHAHAQVRGTAELAGVEAGEWEQTVFETARRLWHLSEQHPACVDLGISSWEGLWATFEGAHERIAPLRELVGPYRTDVWTEALRKFGKDPRLAGDLSRIYIEGQRSGHPLATGAAEMVARAASVGPVALVTNGPPDVQRLKLDQTGLAGHFSAVLISGELGLGKPDPAIFHRAVGSLGADPLESVMVGDSWERDIEGALAAGLRAIWISHGHEPPRSDPSVGIAAAASDVRFA